MNTPEELDLVIIGAGPSGLSAAVYAAREGMTTLVVEKGIIGGLAAITDQIDNYPGFEDGVSGLDLADKLYAQAKRFGATIKTGIEVTGLSRRNEHVILATNKGELVTRSALIATGSTYRHLGVPGETEYTSRGVHYCATCDGPVYRGKRLVVVGGGNSALQETLFLARFASEIVMIVRGRELGGTEAVRQQVQALPNVSYRFNSTVTEIVGATEGVGISGVNLRDTAAGETSFLATDGVFVFIGLIATTEPFAGVLARDGQNFLKTGDHYETEVPGVYVSGDVRSGSTWQIASAVGEGVSATLAIRGYLDSLKATAPEILETR